MSTATTSFKTSQEYNTEAFILSDKDSVIAPKNDTKNGFSRVKNTIIKTIIVMLSAFIIVSGLTFIPHSSSQAEAADCGPTNLSGCFENLVNPVVTSVTDGVKGIFCGAGNANGSTPESAYAGFGATLSPASFIATSTRGNLDTSKPYTAYEKYGISGTNFTFNRDKIDGVQEYDCFPVGKLFTTLTANMIFSVTENITMFAAWVYGFAVGTTAFDGTIKSISSVLGNGSDGGIIQKLYLNYLTPVIMLGAVWIFYYGIIKRAFSTGFSGLIWMFISVAAGLGLMYNSSGLIGFSNGLVQGVVNQTTGVIGGISAKNSAQGVSSNDLPDLCSLPGSNHINGRNSDLVERMVGCRIWQAFVYYPWATGEFGVPPTQGTFRGGDVDALSKINFGPNNTKHLDVRAAQLDTQSIDYTYPIFGNKTAEAVTKKSKNFATISKYITTDKDAKALSSSWAGNDGQNRMSIAIFSIVATIGGTAIIISVSSSLIIYQLGTIFLFLVSPFFLLLGVHPGFGKGIALKWTELLVETVLKRIVLGIFISVVISIFMFLVTNSESNGYASTLFLLVALSIAAMMYKNKFLSLVSALNFGGTQTGLEGSKDASKARILGTVGMAAGAMTGLGGAGAAGKAAKAASLAEGATTKVAKSAGRQATRSTLANAAKSGYLASRGSEGIMGAVGSSMIVGQAQSNAGRANATSALNAVEKRKQQEAEKAEKAALKKQEAELAQAKKAEADELAETRRQEQEAIRLADKAENEQRFNQVAMQQQQLHNLTRGVGQIIMMNMFPDLAKAHTPPEARPHGAGTPRTPISGTSQQVNTPNNKRPNSLPNPQINPAQTSRELPPNRSVPSPTPYVASQPKATNDTPSRHQEIENNKPTQIPLNKGNSEDSTTISKAAPLENKVYDPPANRSIPRPKSKDS